MQDRGLIRRRFGVQAWPINPLEKGVGLDFVGPSSRSQSIVDSAHEPQNEVLGRCRELGFLWYSKVMLPVHYLLAGRHRLLRVERRIAHEHFKHDCTDAPPVALETVPLLQENLRCDVVRCANGAERQLPPGFLPRLDLLLCLVAHQSDPTAFRGVAGRLWSPRVVGHGALHDLRVGGRRGRRRLGGLLHRLTESKVRELHVPKLIEKEVVGLDVPVDVTVPVDALEGKDRLCDVKLRLSLRQRVSPHKQGHHITPWQVLGYQIQELLVLERVVKLHHVGATDLYEKVSFRLDVLHLPPSQHFALLQLLHREYLSRCPFPHYSHLAERTPTNDSQGLEVVRAVPLPHEPRVLRFLPRQVFHLLFLYLARHARLLKLGFKLRPAGTTVSQGLRLRLVHLLDVLLRGCYAPLSRVARVFR
mmetsp:Transcript_13147/g.24990  ORF Transcript_13147/g.24990 Transcript_13147/m.24990 type:complete len:418 (-) Transcript_13147:99-1352(-)